MAGNGWKRLEVTGYAHDWKWLEMTRKLLKMAGHSWKWLEMAVNAGTWPDRAMPVNIRESCKWL